MPYLGNLSNYLSRMLFTFMTGPGRSAASNPALFPAAACILAAVLFCSPELTPIPGADMDRPFMVKAVVDTIPEKSAFGYQAVLRPLHVSQDETQLDYTGKMVLRMPLNQNRAGAGGLFRGEVIEFRGGFERPACNLIPGVKDRRITAEIEKTPFIVRLKSPLQIIRRTPPPAHKLALSKYLRNFILHVEEKKSEETSGLLSALLFGQKGALGTPSREKLNRLGISHLFVISGFHIGILASALYLVFRIGRSRLSVLMIAAVIWSYIWLIGFPIPASRAGVIVTAGVLMLSGGIQKRLFNTLSLAAILLVGQNPASVFLPGFQLTFSCIAGIILLAIPLNDLLRTPERGYRIFIEEKVFLSGGKNPGLIRKFRTWAEDCFRHIPGKALKAGMKCLEALSWPLQAAGCTAAIQFFLFPLLVYYFNSFNFFSLATTAFFMPLISFLVINGLLLFAFWWSPLAGPLFLSYKFIGTGTLRMIDFFDEHFPPLYLAQPSPEAVFFFYGFLLLMLAVNPARGWLFPLLLLIAYFSWAPVLGPGNQDNSLEISMLDVGQGDCLHLRFPNGTSALVDAGGTVFQDNEIFIGKNLIARYLWGSGIRRLEYVLITHPEKDHFAGFSFLDRAFEINTLYCHDSHHSYPDSAAQLSAGDTFIVGGVFHQVLWPDQDFRQQGSLNDRSLVLLLTYGRFRILLTGDISGDIEKKLIRDNALEGVIILKAAHHGSSSSSSLEFIEKLQAETAIISAGRRNPFNHPSGKVINRLESAGMNIYSTPEHGSVNISTDGLIWSISTEAEALVSPLE